MALDRQFVIEVKLRREEVPSFDEYPFALPAIRALDELRLHPSVTFFVGENGSGKSTLLEGIAVACGFNPEGGSKNFTFTTQASHSSLHKYLRISRGHRRPRTGWFLRAESFYNVASDIDRLDAEPGRGPKLINAYGGVSLHKQSHGESFIALLNHRFSPSGLYLLDEPEAALSPARQLAALVRIHDLVKGGAQFVIATHSPILMSYPDAQILRFDDDGITAVDYTDTEHFLITRDFLADHRRSLRRLLHDPDDGRDT
jgi:predicted ATPase